MKKFHPLLLIVLSGLLLFAAWPPSPFSFLIFIAFVPLLWLEPQAPSRRRFFAWTYLTFLLWNVTTTWWVCNSTLVGGISAILPNSLLMCLPWIGFYNVKKRMGAGLGYLSLVLFWMTFEYIHLNWELSWPWLTLGNAFASHPGWVQWYEFTGTSGGSLWILTINILAFRSMRAIFGYTTAGVNNSSGSGEGSVSIHASGAVSYTDPRPLSRNGRRPAIWAAIILILPSLFSMLLYNFRATITYSIPASAQDLVPNVVVVQPNIDPWDEKFVAGKQESQLQKLIQLSESKIDRNTALVVWPETAIPVAINEDEMKTNFFMAPVWDFLRRHPSVNLLTGVEGFRFYTEQNKTPSSGKVPESDKYADSYNSAALMDSSSFQIYHKSRLVPGVELLPSFLRFMTPLFEKFGGTTGGYARQSERTVLNTTNHTYHIAPAVCYESIYGEFMSAYVRNGADLIVVITNDGWWGNTAGYRQHENYARLRAIETRRWLVRSANTGVSCFIDPIGKVIDPQPWDKTEVIRMNVPATNTMTFYTRYGDLLSRLAIAGAILLVLWNGVLILQSARKRHG
jgi:apolipoprotein N-acyltransferase